VPEFYEELARLYDVEPDTDLVPHIMRLATVDERILKDLEIDTRPVSMRPASQDGRPSTEPGLSYDSWGVGWKEVDVGGIIYRELADTPLSDANADDLDDYPWWPNPDLPERYAGVQDEAERLFRDTDYALVACPGFNSVWERAWYMCGFERMLEGLIAEQPFVHAVLRRITDVCKPALARFLDLVGPYVEIVKMGDDLGTQYGPQMSPETYRSMIKPYHTELFALIKQHTDAKVFLHSCGSVYRLLPDLIGAGVEVLNPVQVTAQDMDSELLKREFGDRLAFMGAIDTQHVLPNGSQEDVRREVERRIAHLAPGGGYILAPVHNVQADVPVENLVTMYRHARCVGRYPLD
jgi:uroporphyrinogen decarboxylase